MPSRAVVFTLSLLGYGYATAAKPSLLVAVDYYSVRSNTLTNRLSIKWRWATEALFEGHCVKNLVEADYELESLVSAQVPPWSG